MIVRRMKGRHPAVAASVGETLEFAGLAAKTGRGVEKPGSNILVKLSSPFCEVTVHSARSDAPGGKFYPGSRRRASPPANIDAMYPAGVEK